MTPLRFALIGASGFVAPRHMRAIKETGNELVAALDPSDSVGILDSFFPDAHFFTEFERFDRHIDKLRRKQQKVDYVSICSPNYLHDAHIRFALRSQANAICEKPLVLNPWNIDGLQEIEQESSGRIYNILQLRLHPAIIDLKNRIGSSPDRVHDVDLTYITSRGRWYETSWKGQISKSGGVATNIGIHFFDMLAWVFGSVESSKVHINEPACSAGLLRLRSANVRWFLSVDGNHLPNKMKEEKKRTYRAIVVDGSELEFSDGFGDLHTASYLGVLGGVGFGLNEARTAVELAHRIRIASPEPFHDEHHPFCIRISTGNKP